MNKSFLVAFVLSFLSSTAWAEVLACKQTKLSSSGFNSISAAQSWFPKTMKLDIRGDEVFSDFYGRGKVSEENGRQSFIFVLASSGGDKVTLLITHILRNGRYTARLGGKNGYTSVPGAVGRCKSS